MSQYTGHAVQRPSPGDIGLAVAATVAAAAGQVILVLSLGESILEQFAGSQRIGSIALRVVVLLLPPAAAFAAAARARRQRRSRVAIWLAAATGAVVIDCLVLGTVIALMFVGGILFVLSDWQF